MVFLCGSALGRHCALGKFLIWGHSDRVFAVYDKVVPASLMIEMGVELLIFNGLLGLNEVDQWEERFVLLAGIH